MDGAVRIRARGDEPGAEIGDHLVVGDPARHAEDVVLVEEEEFGKVATGVTPGDAVARREAVGVRADRVDDSRDEAAAAARGGAVAVVRSSGGARGSGGGGCRSGLTYTGENREPEGAIPSIEGSPSPNLTQ